MKVLIGLACLASAALPMQASAAVIVMQVSGTVARTGLAGSAFGASESIVGSVQYNTTSSAFQTGPYSGGGYAYYRPIGGSFTVRGLTYAFNASGAISVINASSDSISFFQSNPTGPTTGGFAPTYLALSFDGPNLVPNTGLPQTTSAFTSAGRPYVQLWFNGGFSQGLTGSLNLISATAVPEPATWSMMIAGFGAVGALLRRRRRGGNLPALA